MASTKTTEARNMMTPEEIAAGVSPFRCKAWEMRKFFRRRRELRKMEQGFARRLAKKQEKTLARQGFTKA